MTNKIAAANKTNAGQTQSNEHGFIMYMNLLPVVLILLLILGAGYLLTQGEFSIPGFSNNNKMKITRFEGFPTTIPVSEEMEKQRLVITSQEELDAFLSKLDPTDSITLSEKVNFDRQVVLAVSNETRETEGYSLKVRRVYDESDKVEISLREERPDDDCVLPQYKNVAVDIVAITRTEKPVDFSLVKEIYSCEEE